MSKQMWDSRYESTEYTYGKEPNVFLVSQASHLKPKQNVLVIADGEGRNGVWLAQQGLNVLSVDYSEFAQRKAKALARERGVQIETLCTDLTKWNWPANEFDVVVSIFAHFDSHTRPKIHSLAWNALKPGGFFILEAFNPKQLQYTSGGPKDRDLLYTAEILRNDFPEAEILVTQEREYDLHEGLYHEGRGAVVDFVARKPLSPRM